MKKFLAVAIVLIVAANGWAGRVRVSYIFMHRSVGLQVVTNCFGPHTGPRNIRDVLDTMTVAVGADTARIVFRSYNLNYIQGDTCLSDTVVVGTCGEDRIQAFRGYNWENNDREKIIYYPPGFTSPMLNSVFQDPHKEDSVFWNPFRAHRIPYGNGDTVTEFYDLVMVKNPYIVWRTPTTDRVNLIKQYYRAVLDTVVAHPELNFCFVLGTPLAFTGGPDSFLGDTTAAKLIYDLAGWFESDSFFTHSNSGPYSNVWKWDPYRSLCETSPDSANRYCLKNAYWAGPSAQSHLSALGAEVMQDSMIAFIRNATQDILTLRPHRPLRRDIDIKIRDYRQGNASIQEVLDLIGRYNSGE